MPGKNFGRHRRRIGGREGPFADGKGRGVTGAARGWWRRLKPCRAPAKGAGRKPGGTSFTRAVLFPILDGMTKLLEQAVEIARTLPPDVQDEIARLMMSLAQSAEPEEIDPEHLPDVLKSLAQAKRGEFATDAEVEAAFRAFEE